MADKASASALKEAQLRVFPSLSAHSFHLLRVFPQEAQRAILSLATLPCNLQAGTSDQVFHDRAAGVLKLSMTIRLVAFPSNPYHDLQLYTLRAGCL